jgi:putative Mn2+ efflux pump MntP
MPDALRRFLRRTRPARTRARSAQGQAPWAGITGLVPSIFFRVALVAASLGLDTFAVAVGIGVRGLPGHARLRVGVSFASAEVLMTFLGSIFGRGAQALLGDVAGYLGFAALVGVGLYMIAETLRAPEKTFDLSKGWGLLVASLSISLDALGIGFSIVYLGVPVPLMLCAIFVASGGAAALGLTLGRSFGARAERNAGVIAGVILIATGLIFGGMHYARVGLE